MKVSGHQKVLIVVLLAVVSSFWLYALLSFSDVDFGENVVRLVRQSDRRESSQDARRDNSIPFRQVNSRSSFTSRIKRATNREKISIQPAFEMTKSSQQIQFTPELAYFYGTPGSIDPQSMTSPGQFSPLVAPQQAYSNAFTPGYLPFQPNGQIACYQNQENTYPSFYCSYIPARPTPVTYQFPAMPGIPDFNTMPRENEDPNDFFNSKLNPYSQILQEYSRDCPPNHFLCDNASKCIPKFMWCNGKIDCADASDEKKCTCRDRVGRQRLCDSYLDCPNGEDEVGCFGCPKEAFSCHESNNVNNTNNCFTLENRCDQSLTCPNGKDEEDCSVLTQYMAGMTLGIFPTGFFSGFLQRNYKGVWYHVCGNAVKWATDACLTKLGHISTKPKLEMIKLPNDRKTGPFLIQDGRMINECPEEVAYVHCPDPSGASISSRSKYNNKQMQDHSPQAANSSSDPIVSIVGGRPSRPGAWPFVVAINKNGRFHCGGAVVNPHWILSAAHCFFGAQHNYYEIEAGTLRRHSFSPAHQIRHSNGIIMHQNFDPQVLSYDIALVRLSEPLYLNEFVSPVTLPKAVSFSGWNMEPSPGASCVALGWGAILEGGPDPDHLQEVEMPIVPCRHSRDRNVAEICAGYKQGGRDACQGDSGGPLMCRNSDSEWYIGGIVSHGIGCARVNEPGAYTKVSYFVDWINEIISERTTSSTVLRPLEKCPGFSCHRPFNRCLPAKNRCDGVVNCLEAEDEGNCPPSLIQSATHFLKGLFGQKRQVKEQTSKI